MLYNSHERTALTLSLTNMPMPCGCFGGGGLVGVAWKVVVVVSMGRVEDKSLVLGDGVEISKFGLCRFL